MKTWQLLPPGQHFPSSVDLHVLRLLLQPVACRRRRERLASHSQVDGGWLPQGLPPQLGLLLLLDDLDLDLDFDGLLLLGDLDEHLVASAGRLDHGGSGSAVGERLLAAAIRSRLR